MARSRQEFLAGVPANSPIGTAQPQDGSRVARAVLCIASRQQMSYQGDPPVSRTHRELLAPGYTLRIHRELLAPGYCLCFTNTPCCCRSCGRGSSYRCGR
jgi:hypothetical protein